MKLTELEPFLYRYEIRTESWQQIVGDSETWRERGCPTTTVTGPRIYHVRVDTLAEAQGVMLLCPKCFRQNNGPVGTHSLHVPFANRGIPAGVGTQNREGEFVEWDASGTGLEDLTITPSILLLVGCGWHGFITKGEIITC